MTGFEPDDIRELTVYEGQFYRVNDVMEHLNIDDEEFNKLFNGCTITVMRGEELIPAIDVMDIAVQGVPRD